MKSLAVMGTPSDQTALRVQRVDDRLGLGADQLGLLDEVGVRGHRARAVHHERAGQHGGQHQPRARGVPRRRVAGCTRSGPCVMPKEIVPPDTAT